MKKRTGVEKMCKEILNSTTKNVHGWKKGVVDLYIFNRDISHAWFILLYFQPWFSSCMISFVIFSTMIILMHDLISYIFHHDFVLMHDFFCIYYHGWNKACLNVYIFVLGRRSDSATMNPVWNLLKFLQVRYYINIAIYIL